MIPKEKNTKLIESSSDLLNKEVNKCEHEYKTNYCNSDGSYSHTVCDDCFETIEL